MTRHTLSRPAAHLCAAGVLLSGLLIAGANTAAAADPVDAAIEAARAADVVFVGEVHDNPAHHAVQARFAAALAPRAIVFEMFPRTAEAALAEARAAGADAQAQADALDWAALGWPPFPDYMQIMDAAPDAALLGALADRAETRRAVSDGAAEIIGEDAARLGLTTALPADQQALREARQAVAHCDMLPPDLLPGMVEAQRLRDAVLAQAALRGRALPGAGPVLVITGNGHADKVWGAPAILALAAPEVSVFVFSQFEADPDAERAARTDSYHVTAPVTRPDPCAAFRNG